MLIMVKVIFLLIVLCVRSGFTEEWARIRVREGHLILMVEPDRNISFVTSGLGSVHVNGEDLVHITRMAKNLSAAVENLQGGFVLPAGETIDVNDSVFKIRLKVLEESTELLKNTTATKQIVSRITRRLNLLQRKVRYLNFILEVNECLSNPCSNGGTCQDLFNNYLCICPSQWEGPTCSKDVNECAAFAGTDLGCQNGATCINKPGSYECACAGGWFGLHCTKKQADCLTAGMDLCGHGTCISQSNSVGYKCICDQGWTTDGKSPACGTDVNECETYPCSKTPLVQCINVPGSFFCGHCPPGYTGNGYHCNDINECETFNGGCSMNPVVLCINTPGSRTCALCPPNYIGDGVTCTYAGGTCGINNGGCHPLASCRHTTGVIATFVECSCPPGYIGNGVGPSGCSRSQAPLACSSNPCINGVCGPGDGTSAYACSCNPRYTGKKCDQRINPCEPNPCRNGGTCVISGGNYNCKCSSDYTGDNCEEAEFACGGKLRGHMGSFRYPAGEGNYEYRQSCAWVIEINSTKVVNITFTNFNIRKTTSCTYDWLQLHDGKNTAAPLIGRFCGENLPNNGTIVSSSHILYFWYRGDANIDSSRNSFAFNWNSTDPICGDQISVKSHGVIKSPGIGNYPNDRDCYWTLDAPVDKRIEFHFFTLMIGESADCSEDYISFHSLIATAEPFAKYCNTSHPPPLTSPSSVVVVHFHSDSSKTYPGFQISYTAIAGIPNCGGTYTEDADIIQTQLMNTNFQYTMTYECEYKIIVPSKMRIKFRFTAFNILKVASQCLEYVTIHEGISPESPVIGKYCGTVPPPPYTSVGNQLLLVYRSRISRGFTLHYDTVCGGTYRESQGIITTSGYPEYEDSSTTCIYEIVQPLGTVITLNIMNITFNSAWGCSFLTVEIRDGDNENSTLIDRLSCRSPPVEIISTHNYLWIKLSQTRLSKRLLYMQYTTTEIGCGGILKDKTGTIVSPAHPSYPSKTTCIWMILVPQDYVIQLTWSNFKLEQGYECNYDFVEVYDNNTNAAMGGKMGRFCGTKLPPLLLSSANIMTIIFKSDASINFDGFIASYSSVRADSVCGGNYFTSAGVIRSPNYPNSYPINRDCRWLIHVQPGNQIMLNITDFQVEYYSNCMYDFLEIRNGGTAASPLVGKFCGRDIPTLIPSHANQLYIHFKSDMTRTAKGFEIYWQSTSTGCGGALTSPKGSIISPHYPEPYSQNTYCVWKISINAGSLVQLVFADIDLENHVQCKVDFVEIFDGIDATAKSLGRYCNSAHPPYLISTQNHVLVKFRSDISFQGRGFQLQYSTVCHNKLTGYNGVIESPNFPNGYPQNQDCLWDIGVSTGNKINLTFSHFELERSLSVANNHCQYDFVEIKYYNHDKQDTIKEGTYCGENSPEHMTINANNTQIHFVSDNLLMGTGFRLEWQIFGCGGVFTHLEGTIETQNYPNAYPKNTRCEWIIMQEVGKSIVITFDNLDLEHTDSCMFDYLEVYSGHNINGQLMTRLCHTGDINNAVTSNGHEMFVVFESDFSYEGTGFQAKYKTIDSKCGGIISTNAGFISSPNYPSNYDRVTSCEWLITINDIHVIDLDFIDVDLVKGCNNTNIKVYDGPNEAYPLLETICGGQKPNYTITSTSNTMFIKMETNSFVTAKGFKAQFKKACGATLSETSGLIEYNNFHFDYTLDCTFLIIAPTLGDHVSLTITYINEENCDNFYPFLRVYNGFNDFAPLIGDYCTRIPPTITSSGSALYIKSSTAFKASYNTFASSCGGTLEHEIGYFATPNYPDDYPADIDCEWTLNISSSVQMSVSFLKFAVLTSDHCNDDFLEIRSGSNNGKLIGVYCGTEAPTNLTHVGPLWFYFKSSKADVGALGQKRKGFKAEYTMLRHADLYGSTGILYSPLYPKFYAKSGYFSWRINVDFGYRVSLTSKEMFIEYAFVDADVCIYGYLTIFDGYDETAPKLGTTCGTEPINYKSSSNIMFIELTFDIVRRGSKFILEWLQVEKVLTTVALPKKNVTTCGNNEIIDMSSITNFTLQSPGYPTGYAPDLNCEWIVSTIPENHLALRFLDLNLQNRFASTCFFDKVQIFSGIDGAPNWKHIKTACTANDTNYTYETSNLMKIVFKTNRYMNETGFDARIVQLCGGTVQGPSGTITLPATVNQATMDCIWNVTVRSGRTMEITFKKFDLGNNQDDACRNYMILRNGQYYDSPMLGQGKYCGRNGPSKLETTENHLYVKFSSETKIPGFILEFTEVSISCGGSISLTNINNLTTISSPNYPNIPLPHTECIWIVRAPPGESLRIDFSERFDLTTEADCSSEYVEIRNGGSQMSPLIGKFCNEIPSTQTTRDNMMFIKFFTEVDEPKNGFKANVSIKTCGGIIRGSAGEISSPFYGSPDLYPQNINCTWDLIGPRDHYLILTFKTLDIGGSNTECDSRIVEMFDKILMNDTTILLGKFCQRPNIPIESASNKVTVVFYSGFGRGFEGFLLKFNASQEECGGNLVGESGFVESPGYPIMNHNKRNCEWNIEVPKGRRIKIEVIDLDLDSSVNLYEQGLAFFNDDDFKSHIKYLKAGDTVKYINSTDNKLSVYFWSSHMSNHRGFKLKYTSDEPTVCIGDLTQEFGVIYSPQNLSMYRCYWTRQDEPPAQRTVTLKITTKSGTAPSSTRNCRHGAAALAIITKVDGVEMKVAEYCSALEVPAVVRIPYLNLNILNSQSLSKLQLNFTVQYSIQNCGGIVTDSFGTIKSPEYPNKPTKTYDCVWVIRLPEEETIKLNFTNMNLGDECEKNFITIHNGMLKTSPRIGTYCRNAPPANILSESNGLWIEYHYGISSNGKGFEMNYEPRVGGCGGIFYNPRRLLQTPLYPSDYPDNSECVWELHADNGYHIGLEFNHRFHLETSNNCENDYVEVFDFYYEDWKSIGKFCGREPPPYLNSTSTKMKVIFRSDERPSGSGFRATWRWNCGGVFIADRAERVITSPGYPNDYKSDMVCIYNITAPDSNINIVFDDFSLEFGAADCKYDNLTIKHTYYRIPLTSIYCGETKPPSRRISSQATLIFKSDSFLTRRGFKFRYYVDNCGGIIDRPTEIKNPSSVQGDLIHISRPFSFSCIWNVTAPKDKVVIMQTDKLNIMSTRYCSGSHLSVYDATTLDLSKRLAKLCGNMNNTVPIIKSTGRYMTIEYRELPSVVSRDEFQASVYFNYAPSTGCGGYVLLNDTNKKYINAPNLTDVDCIWELQTIDGYYLALNFTDIDTCKTGVGSQKIGDCSCSSIEIKDGGGPFSETISILCERNPNRNVYTTSGPKAWIRWQTNKYNKGGFQLELIPVLSNCGPSTLFGSDIDQYLTSPNYPNPYFSNVKCTWRIKSTKPFKNLHLKFIDFDLGELNDHVTECPDDRLEIADKYNSKMIQEGLGSGTIFSIKRTSTVLGVTRMPMGVHQYCGQSGHEYDYYSGETYVTVNFYSGAGQHGKGFKLEFRTVGCDRNYTAQQGRVANENFKETCVISITSPSGTTISIYFLAFYIFEPNATCNNNKFQVFDGSSTDSTELVSLCGFRMPNPIFSTTNNVLIRAMNEFKGYSNYDFTFTSTDKGRGCGGKFYNYRGTFTSPMYPDSYRNISDCTWEINTPYGLNSEIKFTRFDIRSACESNYLLVTTFDDTIPNEHKYCENDDPPVLSSSNKIIVRYVTSFHNGGFGWVAQFTALSDGHTLVW